MSEFTHFDESGRSRMVDVGEKADTDRVAIAEATVVMSVETLQRIRDRSMTKGDVLEVSRLAGIMAAKQTPNLIPLCHPIAITGVHIEFEFTTENSLRIEASVKTHGKTGVEMEALTAVSIAALTVYDMCKAIDRGMTIEQIRLLEKIGGKSGHFRRAKDP